MASAALFHGEDYGRFERGADTDVLHLIGTPVPGELGPMLALEGSGRASPVQPDRLPLADSAWSSCRPSRVARRCPQTPRSDLIRVIAHDIAEASGGAAVIAIPALPNHLAMTLTKQIATTVADRTRVGGSWPPSPSGCALIVFDAGRPRDGGGGPRPAVVRHLPVPG